MFSAPERPVQDEGPSPRRRKVEAFDQSGDFGEVADQGGDAAEALVGLVSFGFFPTCEPALRRRSAVSLVRKAAATMTRLMCRCEACQECASQ